MTQRQPLIKNDVIGQDIKCRDGCKTMIKLFTDAWLSEYRKNMLYANSVDLLGIIRPLHGFYSIRNTLNSTVPSLYGKTFFAWRFVLNETL